MKYFVKLFVVTFLILICTHARAEQKVVYIDMKYILNNSKAGKGAQDYLKNTFKKNQEKFSDLEKDLKKEESNLLENKADFDKEEYKKKTDALRKKVMEYQKIRKEAVDKIAIQRAESRQKLLKAINPILATYSEENNISLIIDKKNLVMGNNDLDITNIIVEKLNKSLPSLNLK
tara:strand:+ start:67 stop:591 length:525 start_codon:yes stop_codon:yes gene_type:complete